MAVKSRGAELPADKCESVLVKMVNAWWQDTTTDSEADPLGLVEDVKREGLPHTNIYRIARATATTSIFNTAAEFRVSIDRNGGWIGCRVTGGNQLLLLPLYHASRGEGPALAELQLDATNRRRSKAVHACLMEKVHGQDDLYVVGGRHATTPGTEPVATPAGAIRVILPPPREVWVPPMTRTVPPMKPIPSSLRVVPVQTGFVATASPGPVQAPAATVSQQPPAVISQQTQLQLLRFASDLRAELPWVDLWVGHCVAEGRNIRLHRLYAASNGSTQAMECLSCGGTFRGELVVGLHIDSKRVALLVPTRAGKGADAGEALRLLLDPPVPDGAFRMLSLVAPAILVEVSGDRTLFAVVERLRWIRAQEGSA